MPNETRISAPPPEVRDYALGLIHRLGAKRASQELGVSLQTAQAIALGSPVMPGSVALVREAMRARGES